MIDWKKLASQLQGALVLPGEPTYDLLRRPFNYRLDSHPAAVARCVAESDVVACVRFAAEHGVALTCRSGGHGAEGFCSVDGELMIDQSAMQQIEVDVERGVVRVGAGAFWGQVDIATYPRGLASPGGGCQEVGVSGLSHGGGFGPIARTWGLTIDNIESLRVVTAKAREVIDVDVEHHEDLFWAIRGGGGGNFGAVTRFTYKLRPIRRALLGGMLLYTWEDTKTVFQFYRDWMNSSDADERLTMLPLFVFGPDNKPMSGISLFYNGDPVTGLAYVQKILADAAVPAPIIPVEVALVQGTLPAYTGTESTTAWPGTCQYWRSGFLNNDFPDEAIDTFMSRFASCPMPPDRPAQTAQGPAQQQADLSFGFIESLGGAIERIAKNDTAFYWREQRFSFTFIGIYDPDDEEWGRKTREWADAFRAAMEPYFCGGVYVNYVQADLPDWKHAYYGEHYDRLRQIKLEHDPDHLFRFPQDLLQ